MLKTIAAYLRRHHLALLALFFALGGTSFAAANALLPRNSVGTKQLRKNAVISSKIKNNSVLGADILESSLGLVPSAANAQSLGGTPASGFYTKPQVDAKTGQTFVKWGVPSTGTDTTVLSMPGYGELHLKCNDTGTIFTYYLNTSSSGHTIWVADDGAHVANANGDSGFVEAGQKWNAQGPDPMDHTPVGGVAYHDAQITNWLITGGTTGNSGVAVHVGITRRATLDCVYMAWGHALG
jgi:hypothetical protein